MNETNRGKLIAYLVTVLVAAVIVALVALRQGLSAGQSFHENARDLSDGFFVAGMMLTGVGLLTLIATTGLFDIFAYGMQTILSHFVPQKSGGLPKYYDFKMEREEHRKQPLRATLYVGLLCLGLAVLFVLLYYR